ncbi:hypothetical protein SLS58_007080 [Diplodia intermedia]|uniref:Uncharacterized protein n=1 Tax=Diplodia intermedia TaxID=856260 RepID=A0ABR3TL33_9PEZI
MAGQPTGRGGPGDDAAREPPHFYGLPHRTRPPDPGVNPAAAAFGGPASAAAATQMHFDLPYRGRQQLGPNTAAAAAAAAAAPAPAPALRHTAGEAHESAPWGSLDLPLRGRLPDFSPGGPIEGLPAGDAEQRQQPAGGKRKKRRKPKPRRGHVDPVVREQRRLGRSSLDDQDQMLPRRFRLYREAAPMFGRHKAEEEWETRNLPHRSGVSQSASSLQPGSRRSAADTAAAEDEITLRTHDDALPERSGQASRREDAFVEQVQSVLRQVEQGYTLETTAVDIAFGAAYLYRIDRFAEDAQRFAREEGPGVAVGFESKVDPSRRLGAGEKVLLSFGMERSQAQEVGDPPPHSASPSSLDQESGLTTASTTISAGDMEAPFSPGEAVTKVSGADNPPSSTGDLQGVPSRRSGRDVFNFMALSAELRNMIYEAVIDTMATTPDTPITLTPESDCYRKYTCWFGGNRDKGEKINGASEDEDESDDVEIKDQGEVERISKLRENFARCRLGEVSRQVRSEFQSLLFDRLHFRVCLCYHQSNIDDGSLPIRQLIGKIRHLDYFTHHYSALPYGDESRQLSDFVDLLLQLRFSGELKIVGWYDHVALIRNCLWAFCASVYAGESNSKFREKAREVTDKHWNVYKHLILDSERVELPFYFNHTDLRSRARSA